MMLNEYAIKEIICGIIIIHENFKILNKLKIYNKLILKHYY